MQRTESADRARAQLAERVARAPRLVEGVPALLAPLLEHPRRLPRLLVTTGIGTSEAHARHLAESATRWGGQPARFTPTGALEGGPPPGAEQDWLVVFSQGLSANSRFALRDVERWAGVVLVCGLPGPGEVGFADLPEEKRAWLAGLEARGVVRIDSGCGPEQGLLIRVIGARVGYAVGWSLLRTLAARRLDAIPALATEAIDLRAAQERASAEVARAFEPDLPVAPFFEAGRSLLLMAEGGLLELSSQLALKIAEGMLRPPPLCVDALHFAHGPLQALAERPISILFLAGPPGEASAEGWLDRLRRTLDPDLHDLRVLRASCSAPFSILEHEAMLDALVLRFLEETGLDLAVWPGAEREAALYDAAPALPAAEVARAALGESAPHAGIRGRSLEESVWPEVEEALAMPGSTALIGLGSVEQHGPHLPLGTDRWIADALVRRLSERLEGAVALPAIPFGCASEHMGFPGTLHVGPGTLEALLADLLDSLAVHGFERAFVFSAHGGNVGVLEALRSRIGPACAPLAVRVASDLEAVAAMQAKAVAAEGLDPESAGPHAGEFETSLVAALRPGSVRRPSLAPGLRTTAEEAQALFYPSLRDRSASGVLGDPTRASARRGQRYLEAWVALLERAYRDAFGERVADSGRDQKKRA
ncbi:MAG TPA: creatininase family protein [Myxococcota bacterium]|nr:creatininase family protein [Myxococcota bacterium]